MRRFTDFDFGITGLMDTFHIDWVMEGDALHALNEYLWSELNPKEVVLLRRDASTLLSSLTCQEIETLWLKSIAGSFPFGGVIGSGRDWMRMIIDQCDAWLSGKPEPQLSTGDLYDGLEERDAVLLLIDEMSEAGALPAIEQGEYPPVSTVLTECARRCTPDLAFRFLIRMVLRSGVRLTAEQYGPLLRQAEAFSYGEFLMANLRECAVDLDSSES